MHTAPVASGRHSIHPVSYRLNPTNFLKRWYNSSKEPWTVIHSKQVQAPACLSLTGLDAAMVTGSKLGSSMEENKGPMLGN